ncbi:putative ubiquitin-conjugating enzyme E2 38 isoform X1 [Zingiber officinale]|uniref:putative ubiquitin-conjugating enzyme E2 38 isoform X1 n=2 Tax=Zingiber officinale TaxID=94328 RepID=UPI001C4CF73B|nr:putative ubiquitin-conjugating enzyme E2 38 isoform X1 [Zingiber officinale]
MEQPLPSHPPVCIDPELGLLAGSSANQDPDIVELSQSAAWTAGQSKRERNLVIPHEVIELDGEDDTDGVMIIGESTSVYKDKQPVGYDNSWQKQIKDPLSANPAISSANIGSSQSFEGDLYYLDDYEYDYEEDDCDYYYDYGADMSVMDSNLVLAAKFDGIDLPTGVEAPEPWFKNPAAEEPKKNKKIIVEDEIDVNYKSFKQFDTVREHSDHYFSRPELLKTVPTVMKINPSKDWAKRIQHEWKVLEKDLPETIYVRVYEDRMDILRSVIIGAAGTPYHDGLFFFDVYFPPQYPQVPPIVHYHSGGLRLNPNLYDCGKVCLSLLNTWSGTGCERWNPSNSTMLQVLVSIQALVLNAKPYFNEPGYAPTANTQYGEQKSLAYNEDTFLFSCTTMLYSLRKPPMHFGDFVAGHFRNRGRTILVSCKAYMDGAQVGCVVGEGVQDVDEGDKSCSATFKASLKKLFEDLLMEFTVKGADCDEFLAQKVEDGMSKRANTTLRL